MKIIKLYKKNYFFEIAEILSKIILKKKKINLLLTGGRTVKKIYPLLAKLLSNADKKIILNLYQTDERLTSIKKNKNSFNIKETFIKNLKLKKINFYSMEVNKKKILNQSKYYNLLNKKIDLTILTLGDDGHIASLFPNSKEFYFNNVICYTKYKSNLNNRISIGTKIITKSNKVLVICYDKKKQQLKKIIQKKNSFYKRLYQILKKANFYIS